MTTARTFLAQHPKADRTIARLAAKQSDSLGEMRRAYVRLLGRRDGEKRGRTARSASPTKAAYAAERKRLTAHAGRVSVPWTALIATVDDGLMEYADGWDRTFRQRKGAR